MNVTSISKCHPARRAQKSKQSWHKLRQREIISESLAPCSEAQNGVTGTEPQLTSPGVRAAAVLLQGSVLGGCSAGGLPPLLMALMMAIVGALLCLLRVDPFIWDLLELVCPGLGKPADIIRHTSYESSSDRTALGVLCLSPITCWR